MNKRPRSIRLLAAALATILLGGCATYHHTGGDGVYYQTAHYRAQPIWFDPMFYPYWSLDHFYFSRHYHPYSVLVDRYDPWYYPYPGWYYGHRLHAGFGYGYPWHGYGFYRPWLIGGHFGARHGRDRYVERVRQIDARLAELETSRSLRIRSQRPDRIGPVPTVMQRLPASHRGSVPEGRSGATVEITRSVGSIRRAPRGEQRGSRSTRLPAPPQTAAPPPRQQAPAPPPSRSSGSRGTRAASPPERSTGTRSSTRTTDRGRRER